MLDRFGKAGKRKFARRFVESEQADAVLQILTEAEDALMEAVEQQHDALELDGIDERPTPEDRQAVIRECWMAAINGEFPEWWVEHFSGLDNADEAAAFANLDDEEWQTTKEEWTARYRRQSMDGDDETLASAHVTARYGVDLDEFERIVVEWPEGRVADHLEDVIAGGVETALAGIERSTEEIEALRDGVDQEE